MKNHLVSDSNCNIVNSILPQINFKEWQITWGKHLVLMTLNCGWHLTLSETIGIGDNPCFIITNSWNVPPPPWVDGSDIYSICYRAQLHMSLSTSSPTIPQHLIWNEGGNGMNKGVGCKN